MALDFSRLYAFKAQLKSISDAAAMSAVLDLRRGTSEALSEVNVGTLLSKNTLDGGKLATITASDVTGMSFNFSTLTSTLAGTWTSANAVRVVSRYTASYTLASMFGPKTRILTDTTIAAFGSVTTSNCLKPWAFPYGAILSKIGQASTNTAYSLTSADIAKLRDSTVLKFDTSSTALETTTSKVVWADVTNGAGAAANAVYNSDSLAATLTGCNSASTLGAGATLDAIPDPRKSVAAILTALTSLCGGLTVCASKPIVYVPIYDDQTTTVTSSGGGGWSADDDEGQSSWIMQFLCLIFGGSWCGTSSSSTTLHVKYIGAFRLTQLGTSTTDFSGLTGYLTAVLTTKPTGTLSSAPGPVEAVRVIK
jgi:hypothetical protein